MIRLSDIHADSDLCPRCMNPMNGQTYCPRCKFVPSTYTPARHHLPPLTILEGKYLVGCTLGEGGFGITYVGWDLQLHAMVAIKEFFPTGIVFRDNKQGNGISVFSGSGKEYFFHDRDRFLEEARMLARFDGNPGVVNVKNYFRENGTAYIVMEYLQGITLTALAEQNNGRLPFDQVMRLLALPMKTLGEMHRQRTFHRDISPDNLMVTDGGLVKLIDFGSTRTDVQDKTRFLKVRSGFSALEMYTDAGREGAYSDIYALCATIYRLLTGVTPPPATDRAQSDTLVPPIQAGARGMTPAQEQALLKGLAVQPRDRFQRVEDLSAALLDPGRPSRRRPRVSRRTARVAAALAALAAVVALGLFLFARSRASRFELTREMFEGAPVLYECYTKKCGYPYEVRARITGDSISFTRNEGGRRSADNDWQRTPISGAQLQRIIDAMLESGMPIHELVLQNLRLETLKPLARRWPNDISVCFDACTLPADWSVLGNMGDSLVLLHAQGEYDMSDLSWLSSLTRLGWLSLDSGSIDLESVSKVTSLTSVIFGDANIRDLTPLARLKNLTLLGLYGNQISDLSPLASLTQLESLSIIDNQVEDLSPLAGLKHLKYVEVTDNHIADFSPIERDGIEIVGRDQQSF